METDIAMYQLLLILHFIQTNYTNINTLNLKKIIQIIIQFILGRNIKWKHFILVRKIKWKSGKQGHCKKKHEITTWRGNNKGRID